jgi:hypothetical protein
MAVTLKTTTFSVITPCSSEITRRFGGIYSFHLERRKEIRTKSKHFATFMCFLHGLLFHSECESDLFLLNVGLPLPKKYIFLNSHSAGGGVQTGSTRHAGHFWPVVPAPDDCEDGEFCGMKIGRRDGSTLRKPAPATLCPPQIPLDQTRAAAVGSQRLTAWAMTRPRSLTERCYDSC